MNEFHSVVENKDEWIAGVAYIKYFDGHIINSPIFDLSLDENDVFSIKLEKEIVKCRYHTFAKLNDKEFSFNIPYIGRVFLSKRYNR